MISHRDLMHLAFNGLCIWSFGPVVAAVLGIPRFLAIYGAGKSSQGKMKRYLQD